MIYLFGGPSQLDTFDLKPDAPAHFRGEFRPIASNVRGIEICEHLPRLARQARRSVVEAVGQVDEQAPRRNREGERHGTCTAAALGLRRRHPFGRSGIAEY